ncbi:MAG: hypothetical protein RIR10_2204, partial [Planctomycetota bacterium]
GDPRIPPDFLCANSEVVNLPRSIKYCVRKYFRKYFRQYSSVRGSDAR